MKTKHAIAMTTAAVLVLTACGPVNRSEAADKVVAKSAPAPAANPSASENDTRIETAFKKSHVYTAYLKSEKIAIKSKDGKVTLSGSVKDADHRVMAQHIAVALPGVASVDNQITLTGEEAIEKSDKWIGSRVKTMLLFHRNVNAAKTEVTVKDGNVTLTGEADSQAQKELTAEYAEDVEGVNDVNNDMTVAAAVPEKKGSTVSEYIDDSSITAQVKLSLLFHRSTSALMTGVDTIDGVVTLTGETKNAAEKDLVAKLAGDINGVKSVVNNMTIEKTVSKAE